MEDLVESILDYVRSDYTELEQIEHSYAITIHKAQRK